MKYNLFYRNVRAREQLDILFISAIGSLLATRFFLYVTGYPQIGGGGLHIGHMLWGGLFMLASITVSLSFIGLRSQRLAALLGGIGFGVFVDEIGKSITSDNNYFFRPAVGIIYAIFVVLYLASNFIGRTQRLTSQEYQLNALAHLEEAIVHDMDPLEQQRTRQLVARADQNSPITQQLRHMLDTATLVPSGSPGRTRRLLHFLDQTYQRFWQLRTSRRLVRGFFIAQAGLFVLAIIYYSYENLDDITQLLRGTLTYGTGLLIGQFVSSVIAAGYALAGTLRLKASRSQAFELFRRATLINMFLTEFFIFSRIEFEALPGFVFNLGVLLVITYVLHQEQRGRTTI